MNKVLGRFGKFIKEAPVMAVSILIWGISILLMLTAIPVAYWPHYEKAVYEKEEYPANVVAKDIQGLDDLRTPPIREEDYDSYGDYINALFERASDFSWDGEYEPDYFSFEIDVADLEPTGFYLEGYQFSTPSTGGGGVGEYRRSGTLFLGDSISRGTEGDDAERTLIRKYHLETDSTDNISYIDASRWWIGYNSELIEMCEQREEIFLGMMISGLFGLLIGFIVLVAGSVVMDRKKGKVCEKP